MLSKNKQDSCLFSGLISFSDVKQKRPLCKGKTELAYNHDVAYSINGVEEDVCHNATIALHGITSARLRRIPHSVKVMGVLPIDMRGKHHSRPNKAPDASFRARQSHYSHCDNPNRAYLPECLNVSLMHKMFLENASNHEEKNIVMQKKELHQRKADKCFEMKTILTSC
ncbi:hypothetical protein PR048_015072 [Dryococelus australis]|uniref:Uncharacterized protein n=1 Tax=Dryococelus australis TaxID=614101 RepID=A0ABQ9HFX5_9NEOP|nr:hypothetical protein PR048_015072 [Dryococelus australis]